MLGRWRMRHEQWWRLPTERVLLYAYVLALVSAAFFAWAANAKGSGGSQFVDSLVGAAKPLSPVLLPASIALATGATLVQRRLGTWR